MTPAENDEDTLHWHALNYRTAHSIHADAAWKELEKFHEGKVAEAKSKSKTVRLNANNKATVILTCAGACIYNCYMLQYPKKVRPEEVATGSVLQIELWQLMQIFGPSIYHGMSVVPFLDNEVELNIDGA